MPTDGMALEGNAIVQRGAGVRFVVIPPELLLQRREIYEIAVEMSRERGPLVAIHAGQAGESGEVHILLEFADAFMKLEAGAPFHGQLMRLPPSASKEN